MESNGLGIYPCMTDLLVRYGEKPVSLIIGAWYLRSHYVLLEPASKLVVVSSQPEAGGNGLS